MNQHTDQERKMLRTLTPNWICRPYLSWLFTETERDAVPGLTLSIGCHRVWQAKLFSGEYGRRQTQSPFQLHRYSFVCSWQCRYLPNYIRTSRNRIWNALEIFKHFKSFFFYFFLGLITKTTKLDVFVCPSSRFGRCSEGDRKEIILWLVGMSLVCYYEALAGIWKEDEADPGMCWYNVSACLVTMAGVVKVL